MKRKAERKPADRFASRVSELQTHIHTNARVERPVSQSHFKRFACLLSKFFISGTKVKKAQSVFWPKGAEWGKGAPPRNSDRESTT